MSNIKNFLKKDDGVTTIEYALIAALIAVLILLTVQGIGTKLNTDFDKISSGL